ncbi:unnamed protein product [marine sediment metagenome]|uniref:Uncharacterized protein n=1 Tax=marine sediment metagenome TaxID=412755 RepID=X1CXC1_9ZZZZ
MRDKNKSKYRFFKAGLGVALLAVFCAMIILSAITYQDVVEQQVIKHDRTWHHNVGDASIAGDDSGFMYLMTYTHQTDPNTTYAANLTNTSNKCMEFLDSLNGEMTNETNHTVVFDFVQKFRVNDTVGYNVTFWDTSWMYANITVDFDFAADVPWSSMTLVEIANNTDFAWYNCYINNSAAGYTLTHNENFNLSVNTSFWW